MVGKTQHHHCHLDQEASEDRHRLNYKTVVAMYKAS